MFYKEAGSHRLPASLKLSKTMSLVRNDNVSFRLFCRLQHREDRQNGNTRQAQNPGHQHGDGVDGEVNSREA